MITSQQQSSYTRQSPIDRIECRYSTQQIIQDYARILAGLPFKTPIEEVPKRFLLIAAQANINYATKRVAIKRFEE